CGPHGSSGPRGPAAAAGRHRARRGGRAGGRDLPRRRGAVRAARRLLLAALLGLSATAGSGSPPARRVLDVVDFGARPDDDGDDTAAIQAAIDALPRTLLAGSACRDGRACKGGTCAAIVSGGHALTLVGAGPHATELVVTADDMAGIAIDPGDDFASVERLRLAKVSAKGRGTGDGIVIRG